MNIPTYPCGISGRLLIPFRLIVQIVCIYMLAIKLVSSGYATASERDYAVDQVVSKPVVVVTIQPWAELVSDIAGDFLDVRLMQSVARDPHHFSLRPSDLTLLRASQGLLWLGESFEPQLISHIKQVPGLNSLAIQQIDGLNWITKAKPSSQAQSKKLTVERIHKAHHAHAQNNDNGTQKPVGRYTHLDPHIWLSLDNRLTVIQAVTDWLKELPLSVDAQKNIQANSALLQQQWRTYLSKWRERAKPLNSIAVIVEHDAFQYLLNELNINTVGIIQAQHEVKPSLRHMLRMKRLAHEYKIGCVITQPQSNSAMVEKIIDRKVVPIVMQDPLFRNTQSGTRKVDSVAPTQMNSKEENLRQNKSLFRSVNSIDQLINALLICA